VKPDLLGPLGLSNLCPGIDPTVGFILFLMAEAAPASEMLSFLNNKKIGNVQHMSVYINLSVSDEISRASFRILCGLYEISHEIDNSSVSSVEFLLKCIVRFSNVAH
jgi:hypothetical protein